MGIPKKSDHDPIERLNVSDMGAFREICRKYALMMQVFASKFADKDAAEYPLQDAFFCMCVVRESFLIYPSQS